MPATPAVAKAWRFPLDQSTWDSYRSLELRGVDVALPQSGEDFVIGQRKYPPPHSTGPDGQGLIPTSDGAGEIVGDGVAEWKTEDLGSGTFWAESVLAIPDRLSYEEAATIPCATVTVWHAPFEKKPLTKDSTVLVIGSGGVSVIGAQLAKAAGARVIATTSSKEKAEKYKALGVDHVTNYREYHEWSEKVKEVMGGEGVEHVLEVGTFIQSVKSTKREGWVHIIGFLDQSNPGATVSDMATMAIFEMGERLDTFIAKHKVKLVVDRVFGWNEAIEAFDYQWKGLHFGKVAIKIE
ncbi:hypothetical protein FRC06_000198 [Ceratobasidium sp. 370]|nr:hypothetical protein FRC06_000198 [Ceratobasidium sp. 370]